MDHRCGMRRYVNIATRVHVPGIGWLPTRIRDLSMSGALVMGLATQFAPHSAVRLALPLPEGAQVQVSSCMAIVARAGREGIGLAFDEFGPVAVRRLIALLNSAPGRVLREEFPVAAALFELDRFLTGKRESF